MALENGLFSIHNTGTPMRFAVDIKPNYAGIAVFEAAPEGVDPQDLRGMCPDEISWEMLEEYLSLPPYETFEPSGSQLPLDANKAGALDMRYNGTFVTGFPGESGGVVYKGRSYVYSDGMTGLDELTDYSIVDIMTDSRGFPTVWRNRLSQTKNERISTSFRWRAVSEKSNALVIFMPFDTGDFGDCRIEVLCDQDPIMLNGTELTGRVDDATIPNDGVYYKKWFYRAEATPVVVAPDATVEVPFSLIWDGDDTAVSTACTVSVTTDSGYLPKTKVVTDESGQGTVKFTALGLEIGDIAHIKVGVGHFTNIGKLKVTVA